MDYSKGRVDDGVVDSPPTSSPMPTSKFSASPLRLSQRVPSCSVRSLSPDPTMELGTQRKLYKGTDLPLADVCVPPSPVSLPQGQNVLPPNLLKRKQPPRALVRVSRALQCNSNALQTRLLTLVSPCPNSTHDRRRTSRPSRSSRSVPHCGPCQNCFPPGPCLPNKDLNNLRYHPRGYSRAAEILAGHAKAKALEAKVYADAELKRNSKKT